MINFILQNGSKLLIAYYFISLICMIICTIVFIRYIKEKRQYEKDQYQELKNESITKLKASRRTYPDFYYSTKAISTIIIVPKLPDPASVNIQHLLLQGCAFCLESEYMDLLSHAPFINWVAIWVYAYTDEYGCTAHWTQLREYVRDGGKNIGKCYHPFSEIWSSSYLKFIESDKLESEYGMIHTTSRSKPSHIQKIITDECTVQLTNYSNQHLIINNTYHDMIECYSNDKLRRR